MLIKSTTVSTADKLPKLVLTVIALSILGGTSWAADNVWTRGAGTLNWNVDGNWSQGGVPLADPFEEEGII